MWVFDTVLDDKAIPDLRKYKLRVVDFIHAAMTVLVFGAVALRDRNIVHCFYPQLRKSEEQFVNVAPIGIGLFCSMMFVLFPTRRHGVGYPVTN
ncbi:hypothetical protein ZOSMA_89G00370 [Zostera marina]|uniref:Uncharacterized protein n=1 Tax=Zostera marina TaxID=29655 RepID=A0A0K9NJZ8_ZOSMR|nr:hypothetical protein ZOSMA_89G00370 [Zostera marina]